MIVYKAPLEDLRFLLYELFDYEGTVGSLPPATKRRAGT
jgi:hypothetical protein